MTPSLDSLYLSLAGKYSHKIFLNDIEVMRSMYLYTERERYIGMIRRMRVKQGTRLIQIGCFS